MTGVKMQADATQALLPSGYIRFVQRIRRPTQPPTRLRTPSNFGALDRRAPRPPSRVCSAKLCPESDETDRPTQFPPLR